MLRNQQSRYVRLRKLFGNYKRKKVPYRRPKKRLFGNSRSSTFDKKYIPYICLVAVGTFLITATLQVLVGGVAEDAAARTEYEKLREDFPVISAREIPDEIPEEIPQAPIEEEIREEQVETIAAAEEEEDDIRYLSLDELARINRDFVGWITIGSTIDYPVVRGSDNDRYIETTFAGHRNSAGAIFMDFRNTDGFDEYVSILYGHFTRDGSMFSPLIHYLDPGYLQRNPNIVVTTRDGRMLTYRIFAASLTDAWDDAYTVAVRDSTRALEVFTGAPENASRFLLLSTCTRGSDDDERILVFSASID